MTESEVVNRLNVEKKAIQEQRNEAAFQVNKTTRATYRIGLTMVKTALKYHATLTTYIRPSNSG
jgi:hypothetical protein